MEQNDPAPDYGFLQQEDEKPGLFASLNKKKRILVVVAGGGILLLFLMLLLALALGGGPDTKERLITIAQRQNELIRIADIGTNKARSQTVQASAVTAKASIGSSQRRVIANVANKGTSLGNADLRLREQQQTTSALESAEQANRFDEVFTEIMQEQLNEYMEAIRTTADNTKSSTDTVLLQELFDEAAILLKSLD